MLYFFALARSQRMAAWQSWAWAGKIAFWLKRYSTLAAMYPRGTSKTNGQPDLLPPCQPPPWIQTSSGSGFSLRCSGKKMSRAWDESPSGRSEEHTSELQSLAYL